jgi:hypothetical protein
VRETPGLVQKFLSNLVTQFESADAEGPKRIVKQRPADAFPDLDDDQLRYFSHGTMEQFIQRMERLKTP